MMPPDSGVLVHLTAAMVVARLLAVVSVRRRSSRKVISTEGVPESRSRQRRAGPCPSRCGQVVVLAVNAFWCYRGRLASARTDLAAFSFGEVVWRLAKIIAVEPQIRPLLAAGRRTVPAAGDAVPSWARPGSGGRDGLKFWLVLSRPSTLAAGRHTYVVPVGTWLADGLGGWRRRLRADAVPILQPMPGWGHRDGLRFLITRSVDPFLSRQEAVFVEPSVWALLG